MVKHSLIQALQLAVYANLLRSLIYMVESAIQVFGHVEMLLTLDRPLYYKETIGGCNKGRIDHPVWRVKA